MSENDLLQTGIEVLTIEAEAVRRLAHKLDREFVRAVEMIAESDSRVIVTGIGKSGLVGKKIAATLSSCGTPALFVHPVEAGHGDLGQIASRDIMLAISYSGDTREILDLVTFVKRIGIRLIGLTGNPDSQLARYSDIILIADVEREAGPDDFIPTASSTAAMAIGDALAIAIMKKKGFSRQDFAGFHPMGQLGKKLLKIDKLMHRGGQIPIVQSRTPMREVLREMSGKQLGMTCVTDDTGRLTGVITDGDLRRQLERYGEELLGRTAGECMTAKPLSIHRDELAARALNIMESNKVTSLVVVDRDGRVEGIIHLHNLWRTEMF